jgi:hypothetical protein
LGLNALVIPPGFSYTSPVLFAAGLNSFMLILNCVPAPALGFDSLRILIQRPTDEFTIHAFAADQFLAATVDQAVTWGAFSPTLGIFGGITSGFVWWLFQFNIGSIFGFTATGHLFGARR